MGQFDKTLLFLHQKWANIKAITLKHYPFDPKYLRTLAFEVKISHLRLKLNFRCPKFTL